MKTLDHSQSMHVHDPSFPDRKRLHFLVKTVNYCNKSLS